MGLSDKFQIPKVYPSGFVFGSEFNAAMEQVWESFRFSQNMGGYIIDKSLRGGSFPSFQEAFDQAKQEVPADLPIVLIPTAGQEYDEDLYVDDTEHDVYLMSQNEDYTDTDSSMWFKGLINVAPASRWTSGRRKMLNIFGFGLDSATIELDSGWDLNMRRCLANNVEFYRQGGAEGCKMWCHDVIFQGALSIEDYDAGVDSILLSHCNIPVTDVVKIPLRLRGSYYMSIIESLITFWAGAGAGMFDFSQTIIPGLPPLFPRAPLRRRRRPIWPRPPGPIVIPGFSGTIQFYGNDIQVSGGGTPLIFYDGGSAYARWHGSNIITHTGGDPTSWDFGALAGHESWPECRLKSSTAPLMPLNPPNGCRAVDYSDYSMKYWNGAAWV